MVKPNVVITNTLEYNPTLRSVWVVAKMLYRLTHDFTAASPSYRYIKAVFQKASSLLQVENIFKEISMGIKVGFM